MTENGGETVNTSRQGRQVRRKRQAEKEREQRVDDREIKKQNKCNIKDRGRPEKGGSRLRQAEGHRNGG